MTKVTITREVLIADAGMVLTNGETYSSVGGSVQLSVGSTADNWHEITEEEYEEIQNKLLEELDYE